MSLRLASLLASLVLLSACSDNPPGGGQPLTTVAKPPQPQTAQPAMPSLDVPSKPAVELAWDAPASFKKIEHPSKMRRATYEMPKVGSDPEAPTMSVTVLGGTVDENVNRWIAQFDEPAKASAKRETKKVGVYEATVLHIEGVYSGGNMMGPSTPQPDYALLGAVVPVGADLWFFKMTGPKASVAAARPDFDQLVSSLRATP
jgi:hypothetical protein